MFISKFCKKVLICLLSLTLTACSSKSDKGVETHDNVAKDTSPEGICREREGSSKFENVYCNGIEFSERLDLSKLVFFLYLNDIDFEKEVSKMPAGLMTVEEMASYYPAEYNIDKLVFPNGLKEVDMEFDTSEHLTINQFIIPNMDNFRINIDDTDKLHGHINYMQFPNCWSEKVSVVEELNKDCVIGVPAEYLEGFKANYPEYNFVEATYQYE